MSIHKPEEGGGGLEMGRRSALHVASWTPVVLYTLRETRFCSEKMKIKFDLLPSEGLVETKRSAREFLV